MIRGGAKGATSTGKCGPHCSVEHELAVEGGGITSGEDKVQDGTEGVGEKDGMQEKVMWVESERAKNNEDICVLCKCSPKGEFSREGF